MPSEKPQPELGNSWVMEGEEGASEGEEQVEGKEGDSEEEEQVEGEEGASEEDEQVEEKLVENDPDFQLSCYKKPYSPTKTHQRATRRIARSPELVLVMPSINLGSMDGSLVGTTERSTQPRKSNQVNEKARDSRTKKLRQIEGSINPEELSAAKRANEKARDARIKKSRRIEGSINLEESSAAKRVNEKARDARIKKSRRTEGSINQEESSAARTVKKPAPKAIIDPEQVLQTMVEHLTAMLSWSIEVVGRALRLLKTPISYLLAIWMLFGLGIIARYLIMTSVNASLSPICRIPGTSFLHLPFCPRGSGHDSKNIPPIQFDKLMTVQARFEDVLDQSTGTITLSGDMKRGEASVRDLRQLVLYSEINSKNELMLEFNEFVEMAKKASHALQRFQTHVGRTVDSVLSTSRWTTRVLDGIQEQIASRGAIRIFINDKLLAPFQSIRFTERALLDQYIKHAEAVEEDINKLVDEAYRLMKLLNGMEDILENIHGIVTKDQIHAQARKEEIMSELWSMVGGNSGRIINADKRLNLLQKVGVYRKSAIVYVVGTIVKVQAIGTGIEDLRTRVATPELLRDQLDIPLSVHIDNILRGVARLEEQREALKKAENEHYRQPLDGKQMEGRFIDG